MSEEELKKEMEEEIKNKMDTFIECYKNGMIFGSPTDIEFYEKIATLQQKVEQLENIRKETIEYINNEIFKRTILVGVGTKKYTRNILDNILNILNKGSDKE